MYENMLKTPFFSLRATLWTVLLLSPAIYAQGCDVGWYGPPLCQHKCHCTNYNCDSNGDCTNGATCVKGWFVDLSYRENDGTAQVEFRDADDTTCNGDPSRRTVTMSFKGTVPFTWLRLLVNIEGLSLESTVVKFINGAGNKNIPCNNMKTTLVNSRTIDIYCDIGVEVKQIQVTGDAVGYLCSFYATGECDVGWFGLPSCQYKCRCTNNNCDNNGDCTNGARYVKGWFGPQCQYVDLSYTQNDATTKEIFHDADDTTCNGDPNHKVVNMSFKRTFPFTWLRLLVSTEGQSLDNIEVILNDGNGDRNIQCNNRRSALINSRTIDIHCDVNVEVKQVRVIGVAIGYLCSFYVNGGRNIALKQSASQGSTQDNHGALEAVDGDTRQILDNGTCTHTQQNGYRAFWDVLFSRNNYVDRYVIYNRVDCCQDRLKGFILTAYDQNSSPIFTHTDTESLAQDVYTLTSRTDTSPIRSVNINATNSAILPYGPVLTLCEVEIYGDSLCLVNTYGRECEYECHCANNDPCFVSTGMCPNNDCAVGYTGVHCDQPCPEGFYGKNCQMQCSDKCVDGKCDSISGRCDQCPAGMSGDFCDQPCCNECPSGKTGDQCNQNCPPTKYGSRCIYTCSATCVKGKCSGDNGRCDQCPDGKTGDQCDQDCPPTQYGPRCVNECSPNCLKKTCEGDSGRCIDCPSGMTGDLCDKECFTYKYGPRCIHNCSIICLDKLCDRVTGHCDECVNGKHGDFCDQVCVDGKYGDGCKETCGINCKVSKQCDSVSGTCFDGCSDGYIGDLCEDECEFGKYGSSCSSNCSDFCKTNGKNENESPCHHVSGTCLYGCVQGYDGPACLAKAQTSSPSNFEPGVGVGVGIGVGVTVIVVLAVLGVYFYRRRQLAQKARKERPPGYDPADPTTEDHNYKELFKSHDDYNLPTDEVSSSVNLHAPSKTSTVDNVQYVNTDINADVNQYEDIDQVTSEIDQGRSSKARENNSGYANC